MTMPASGPISLGQANTELGLSSTALITMNDAALRTLAGVGGSGTTWSMNSLYGKTYRVVVTVTIGSNTQNYIANTAKVTGYVAGKTDVTFVISAGVVVGSASTGSYAFTVDTSWNAGDTVTVSNSGTIIGAGGGGGAGGASVNPSTTNGVSGSAGGPAVSVGRTVSWTNAGTTGGGGGGGGGGGANAFDDGKGNTTGIAGGGGGGGRGNNGGAAGAGGASSGWTTSYPGSAGTAGTSASNGSGGLGGSGSVDNAGGNGGGLGSAGATGTGSPSVGGYTPPGSGGAAGACLVGKSFVNSGAGITGGTTGGGQS